MNGNATKNLPMLMGILNVTPDSFADGGRFMAVENAIAQAENMIKEGANIIDVGGESTRPGALPVLPDEEWERVGSVLRAIAQRAKRAGVMVSIDTRHEATMERAIAAGADIVNDVSALADPRAVDVVRDAGVRVILMHMQGAPATMQAAPHYEDVVGEVFDFLLRRRGAAMNAGIAPERIWLDPGIGFGKNLAHNLALFERLADFAAVAPVVVGASRKRFIAALAPRHDEAETEPSQRLPGSLVAAVAAAARGASVLRVHDVAATRQALQVAQGLRIFS